MTLRDWCSLVRVHAQRQGGQTMTEYGVVLAVITIAVVAVVAMLSGVVTGRFQDVVNVFKP